MSPDDVNKYNGIEFPSLAIVVIHVAHFTFWPVEAQTFNIFSTGVVLFLHPLPSSSSFVICPALVLSFPHPLILCILCNAPSMSRVLRVNATDPHITNYGAWTKNDTALVCTPSICQFFF